MADDTCAGCGKAGGTCADCAHSNWCISCGCDNHGDHGGCTKECSRYGCAHPKGLVISGTLEESDKYSDQPPPPYLLERAVLQEMAEVERKHRKKMRKLQSLLEEARAGVCSAPQS